MYLRPFVTEKVSFLLAVAYAEECSTVLFEDATEAVIQNETAFERCCFVY